MRTKLFSRAHLRSAEVQFPDRIKSADWKGRVWTDQELKDCVQYEFSDFIKNPNLQTYPASIEQIQNFSSSISRELDILDDRLNAFPKISSMLSVGCGFGEKEMWLAQRHPDCKFTCVDMSPACDSLNLMANELGIKNIVFFQKNAKQLDMFDFPLLFSWGMLYCLNDAELRSYFRNLTKSVCLGAELFVGTAANISLLGRLQFLGETFRRETDLDLKQTGWRRSFGEVKKCIPSELKLIRRHHLRHEDQVFLGKRFPPIVSPVSWFSQNVFPVSNSSYLMHLIREK